MQVRELIEAADTDKDGVISRDEFMIAYGSVTWKRTQV